jgi:hypothetical protein
VPPWQVRVFKLFESFDIVEKSCGRCGARTMQNPPTRTYIAVPHFYFAQELTNFTTFSAQPDDELAAAHHLCSAVLR